MSKNILITGVSRGLGLATSEFLLARGHCIYGVSRSCSKELESLKLIYPNRLKLLQFDLSDLENLKEKVFNDFIPKEILLHALVNNAATAYSDLVTNLNIEKLEQTFQLNVFAPFLLTNYVIRNMVRHRTAGNLIHLSSISAHTGYKGLAMYAATKGALEAFSKNTAREWGRKGIRSNCIVAGFMETEMSAAYTTEERNRIFKRTALKKPVAVASVVNAIDYLMQESCAVTGQNLFVDNGAI
ncbi:MAG: SDR family NAD(P)-dependent oxidoreductase [Saprospiraceae bacterium]